MIRPGMYISDRYEIVEKVGSGGMADVYKAKDQRLNRYVAIKVLKSEFSADKKFVSKFRGEAQSAAGLSHPNIVNVYDVGEDEGLYYIVMELVEGITLKNFIERKGKLEVKEAVGIAIQIAMGMEAAHNNHIIHRDIKPQNIIISKAGKVKVTDFGIAKAATSNTITSNAMGSVHYISPEQARGGYSDEPSDIYSLGITMYEMLSGRVPFTGENTVAVALLHIQEEAVPLREIDESIPVSVEKIVQKCMQKKPEYRYASASALIADLKRSITNPNGNFVSIAAPVVSDSPTKQITDEEVSTIKTAAKTIPASYAREPVDTSPLSEDDYESGGKDVDPKLEKIMIIGGVAAAVILAVIIIVLVVKLMSGGKPSKENLPSPSPSASAMLTDEPLESDNPDEKMVPVPSVIGKSYEEAKDILEDAGFIVRFTQEVNEEVEENHVISQDPKEDEEAKEGSIIRLVISTGEAVFPIPDISGKSLQDGVSALRAEGFENHSEEYEYNDTVPMDSIIRTEPSGGSSAAKSAVIKIYVSRGPETKMTVVPDLMGKTENEAIRALEEKNLSVGNVSYDNDDTVEKGLVIHQGYTVGSEVEEGTLVDITVSDGPKEEEKVYKYIGSASLTYNPFDDTGETGIVSVVLTQDGKTDTVFSEECDVFDFPLKLDNITGYSESEGVLQMYLDGNAVGDPISITFIKQEQVAR